MRKKKFIDIIMVEDHDSLRESFESYFKTVPGIRYLAGVSNGLELFEELKHHEPDLVLLDLEMPIMNGFLVLPKLKEQYPEVKVIVLTTHDHPALLVKLMNLGANAYLTKHCGMDEIVLSIHRVMEEGFWMDGHISRKVFSGQMQELKKGAKFPLDLNEKEREVLDEYCKGYGYTDIAKNLNLSRNTVKYYLRRIHQKTEISEVTQLVKYAIKNGITSLE